MPANRYLRRTLLRNAGVALALPLLDQFLLRAGTTHQPPRRMVCICAPLGLHGPFLFPAKEGSDYERTPYLEVLKDFRADLTIMSGLAHPGVDLGHDSIFSFLTGVPHPERKVAFRNSISLDQFAADRMIVAGQTRLPSLTLSADDFSLSWSRTGVLIPPENSPSRLFTKLFLDGAPAEVETQVARLRDGQSILDQVRDQANKMRSGLGRSDGQKLDEYVTSVRDLEKRLAVSQEWSKKPKPKVDAKPPQDISNVADLIGRMRLLFDLAHLALETDSTRLISILLLGTSLVPPIQGVSEGHHNLSHHGKDPKKLEQLKVVELEELKVLRELLAKLKQSKQGGVRLLDQTMVFLGSNLGNANSHSCKNLPVLLAGGGFKHGQYLAFDPANPPPLCNLYVSMLQRLGIEVEAFGSSTGTLTGLEIAH